MQIEAVQDFVNRNFAVEFTSALWNSHTHSQKTQIQFLYEAEFTTLFASCGPVMSVIEYRVQSTEQSECWSTGFTDSDSQQLVGD